MLELYVATGLRRLADPAEQESQHVVASSLAILVRPALALQGWRQPSYIGIIPSLLQEAGIWPLASATCI